MAKRSTPSSNVQRRTKSGKPDMRGRSPGSRKTQFGQGMADNRRNLTGWPKKVEARHTLEKELEEKIPITIGGREMLVTKEEAVIRGTVNDAIRGDHRARKAVFDCIKARDARTQDGQEIAALYDTELMDQLYAEYEQQMREAAGQRETTGEDEPGGEDR